MYVEIHYDDDGNRKSPHARRLRRVKQIIVGLT